MQDAHFSVGEWACGSWGITVASTTLLVSDNRMVDSVAPVCVVQIGEAEGLGHSTMARMMSRYLPPPLPPASVGY